MEAQEERDLLARLARGDPGSWEAFLEAFAGVLFRVVCLFADSYDNRMDLFLFICSRLREQEMKRLRAFRERPGTPCRFSTYVTVVARNICVDFLRSREGRFRLFRSVAAMDETDRLLFEYVMKEGRQVEEARNLLRGRHGIRLGAEEASERAARIAASLSAKQRWKLLSRLASRQGSLPIDPIAGLAGDLERLLPLDWGRGSPEKPLIRREAQRILEEALSEVSPRQRMALTLRFRDGMGTGEIAAFLAVTPAEAEGMVREALARIRERLKGSGIARLDLDSAGAASFWST